MKMNNRLASSSNDPYLDVEINAYNELLRQAEQTFNIHITAIGSSFLIAVVGSLVFLHNQAPGGVITAAMGTGVGGVCVQVARETSKESNKKIEKLIKEVKTLRGQVKPPN